MKIRVEIEIDDTIIQELIKFNKYESNIEIIDSLLWGGLHDIYYPDSTLRKMNGSVIKVIEL